MTLKTNSILIYAAKVQLSSESTKGNRKKLHFFSGFFFHSYPIPVTQKSEELSSWGNFSHPI